MELWLESAATLARRQGLRLPLMIEGGGIAGHQMEK